MIKELRRELDVLAKNPGNIKDYSRFHKDGRNRIGLSTPVVRKLSAEKFREIGHLDKKQILDLCEKLLKHGDSPCQTIAFDWAFRIRERYAKEDFQIFERWLDRYVDDWGSCDDLCTRALGYFALSFPELMPEIYRWAKSKNMWKRRASAVSLIYAARRGKCFEDILEIAKELLSDKEDLVQKAYGWMLKEASKSNEKEVFDFVMEYKDVMQRTALRYAIERMPTGLKKRAIQKD